MKGRRAMFFSGHSCWDNLRCPAMPANPGERITAQPGWGMSPGNTPKRLWSFLEPVTMCVVFSLSGRFGTLFTETINGSPGLLEGPITAWICPKAAHTHRQKGCSEGDTDRTAPTAGLVGVGTTDTKGLQCMELHIESKSFWS